MKTLNGDVVRMAAAPLDGVCYTEYDAKRDLWSSPPGTGILMARDLEARLNFSNQLIYTDSFGAAVVKYDAVLNKNVTRWNGIIGRLVDDEADWSMCGLTRTYARSLVTDYSPTPYELDENYIFARLISHQTTFTRLDGVFHSFDATSWLLIGSSLVLYSLLLNALYGQVKMRHFIINFTDLLRILVANSTPNSGRLTVMSDATKSHKPTIFVKELIVLLWIISAAVLSILYASELISGLTSAEHVDMIKDWPELFQRVAEGRVMINVLGNSASYASAVKLFGHTHVTGCNSQIECVIAVLDQPFTESDRDHPQQVWYSAGMHIMNALPRFGIHADAPEASGVYMMGREQGMDPRMIGYVFNKRRSDLRTAMEPLLVAYNELGHVIHWSAQSTNDLLTYYAGQKSSDRHSLEADKDDDLNYFILSVDALLGTYVMYAICLCFALAAISLEVTGSHFYSIVELMRRISVWMSLLTGCNQRQIPVLGSDHHHHQSFVSSKHLRHTRNSSLLWHNSPTLSFEYPVIRGESKSRNSISS